MKWEKGVAGSGCGECQRNAEKGWPGKLLAIIVLSARLLYSHSWPLSFVATAVAWIMLNLRPHPPKWGLEQTTSSWTYPHFAPETSSLAAQAHRKPQLPSHHHCHHLRPLLLLCQLFSVIFKWFLIKLTLVYVAGEQKKKKKWKKNERSELRQEKPQV